MDHEHGPIGGNVSDERIKELIGPMLRRVPTRKNQGYIDRLRRARSWMVAGDLHRDDLDIRFACYWIALNAMYGGFGTPAKSTSPKEHPLDFVESDLRQFAGKICGLDRKKLIDTQIRGVRDDVAFVLRDKWHFPLYWSSGTTPRLESALRRIASEASSALKAGRTTDYLALVMGRVQDIRNHVFHGSATYRFSKNRGSVQAATAILTALVPTFVQILESPWAESDVKWPSTINPGKWTPQNPDSQG